MSEYRHLRVHAPAPGRTGTVELDGVPLADALRGLTLTLSADDFPRVALDPLVMTADIDVAGPLRAVVLPKTHDVLVALGWTPPAPDRRLVEALAELADTLGDPETSMHVAGRYACGEADRVAAVLALSGHRDAAACWIAWHGDGADGVHDRHRHLQPIPAANDPTGSEVEFTRARAWVDEQWPVNP